MSDFLIADKFSKKSKMVCLVYLDRDYLDREDLYITLNRFINKIYSEFSEQEQYEILEKLNNFKIQNQDVDHFIFINKNRCKFGRDTIREVACINRLKQTILEDDSIPDNV